MKSLRTFRLVIGLQLIAAVYARTTDGGSCARKSGISIQPISKPHTLSEGPHWDVESQVLYYVDIPNQQLYCWDPATGNTTMTYIKNGKLGVAVPVAGQKNTFVAGAGTDFVQITWDPKTNSTDPKIKVLSTVEVDLKGTRFNDGKIDPKGRFWAGTMGMEMEPNMGSLYRFGPDFVPKKMVTPVTISNGLAWSHDNTTFYYIDSPTKQVWAYDYNDETGDLSKKRVLFDFMKNNVPGIPDGMTIDADGNLWVASYDGGRVINVDAKTGKLLKTVEMPAKQVTSAAFGGPNLDILYVTTARQGLKEEDLVSQPLAGCVFAIKGLGVTGTPMLSYKM